MSRVIWERLQLMGPYLKGTRIMRVILNKYKGCLNFSCVGGVLNTFEIAWNLGNIHLGETNAPEEKKGCC